MTITNDRAGIAVDVDGESTDLSEVDWFLRAPCGCVAGATLGYSNYAGRTHVVATADDAMRQFNKTKVELDRAVADGFTAFPDLRHKVTELMVSCSHEPKWGVIHARKDGHTWAASNSFDSRSKLTHLVADDLIANPQYGPHKPAALCGAKAYRWSNDWHATMNKVTCRRCEKAASR